MSKSILMLVIALCMQECSRADDASAIVREIKSGQKELAEVERSLAHVRCKQFHQVHQKSGNHHFDSYRSGDKILLDAETFRTCLNGTACFFIKRTSLSTPYTLAKFTSKATDERYRNWTATFLIAEHPLTTLDESQTIGEFLDDPSVTFTEHVRNADGTVGLNYTLRKTEGENSTTMVGNLIFDKRNLYAVVRHDKILTFSGGRIPVAYSMIRSFKPLVEKPTVTEFSETYLSGGKTIRFVKNELDYPDTKLDDAEFTLEHYGIATPADDVVFEDRRFNWPLWVGIGVGLLVLSVILARIARRRIRSQSGD